MIEGRPKDKSQTTRLGNTEERAGLGKNILSLGLNVLRLWYLLDF